MDTVRCRGARHGRIALEQGDIPAFLGLLSATTGSLTSLLRIGVAGRLSEGSEAERLPPSAAGSISKARRVGVDGRDLGAEAIMTEPGVFMNDPAIPNEPDQRSGRSRQWPSPARRTRTGVTLQAVDESVPEHRAAPEDALIAEDLAAAEASNTRRAYVSGWRRFDNWCVERDYAALPAAPRTVARYFAAAARERKGEDFRYKTSTFGVWLAAIGDRHAAAGFEHPGQDPLVTRTLRGIRRRRIAAGRPRARRRPC